MPLRRYTDDQRKLAGEAHKGAQEMAMSNEPDFVQIRQAIRDKYAKAASSATGKFKYPTGRAGAEALGYDPAAIREAPAPMLDCFCGVGNPFSLGEIRLGERVLDIGCGGGFDLYVASRSVGVEGRVYGIDFTPQMFDRARGNLATAGAGNAEVKLGSSEDLPFADDSFDVIISNGVLNLSPFKEESFQEIFRVLRPGGRLQFADMVLREDLPPEVAGSAEAWSQ